MDVQEFDTCYAFVEFEDTAGLQNAIKVLICLQEFELVNFVLKSLVGNVKLFPFAAFIYSLKASPIELAGRQIHIEERRGNSINSYRGGSMFFFSTRSYYHINLYSRFDFSLLVP